MCDLRKIARAVFLPVALFCWTAAPAYAQNIPDVATPSPGAIPQVTKPDLNITNYGRAPDGFDIATASPAIADAIANGGRAFYIGVHGGLDGWILVRGNEIQTVYVTADRKTFMVGLLFGAEGYNITGDQVRELIRNNRDVASLMTEMMKQQLGINGEDSPVMTELAPIKKLGHQSVSAPMITPDQQAAEADKKILSGLTPGERLLLDLQDATGVDVGDRQAPVLYMVMDPNCPHCQATWRMLRDAVLKKNLRIHLVPMGRTDDDERAAAQLLRAKDPLTVWDKYVGGDKAQLAGDADPKLMQGVRSNHVLADSWSISQTPYLVYRSKTGEIKVLAGEPDHAEALLGDIGP